MELPEISQVQFTVGLILTIGLLFQFQWYPNCTGCFPNTGCPGPSDQLDAGINQLSFTESASWIINSSEQEPSSKSLFVQHLAPGGAGP